MLTLTQLRRTVNVFLLYVVVNIDHVKHLHIGMLEHSCLKHRKKFGS